MNYQQVTLGLTIVSKKKVFMLSEEVKDSGLVSGQTLVIEQVLTRSLKNCGGLSRGRGVNENARTIWIHSMHRLAGVHGAMSALTGQIHQTSDQHVEEREARIERDQRDKTTLQNWLEDHSPYTGTKELVSIANGMTASIESVINCDNAEDIGAKIQQSLDVNYQMSKIKRSEKVKTMTSLLSAVKIDNEDVTIDLMMHFSRLIVMAMREKNIASYFSYELSPYLTSLFKDGIMCDPKKSKLRDYLTKNVLQAELPVGSFTHIIDSGALLYSVKWIPDTTYRDIVKQYQNYLLSTFGLCTVIFDGYNNGPSTKDIKHVRGSRTSQTVTVDLNKRVTVAQEKFLKNGFENTDSLYKKQELMLIL